MIKPEQTFAISIISYGKHLKINEVDGLSLQQRKAIKSISAVLQKSHDKRTVADEAIINKFIKISEYFSKLSEKTSFQLCKNLVKNSRIVQVPSGRVICHQGARVTSIYLLLNGKFGKASTNQKSNFFMNQEDRYPSLMQKSSKRLRQYKLYLKQQHQQIGNQKQYKEKIDIIELQLSSTISPNNIYGQQSFLDEEKYHETVVSLFSSSFLEINIIDFMEAYYTLRQRILQNKMKNCIRACEVFKELSEDRFKYLVSKFQIIKLDKGQNIYTENQKADCLYILLNGQVGLSKKVRLFAENPNNLYANRSILLQDDLQNQKKAVQKNPKKQINSNNLRYADFTSIYNYHPKQKFVQLTSLEPVSLFGEEEVFQNIPREVNAYAVTNDVQLFKIPLKLIQTVFSQKKNNLFESFKQKVYQTLTKQRILYRQQKLAELLDFQNKNNMDYFYIQSDDVPALSANNSMIKGASQSRIKPRPQSSSPKKTSRQKLYVKKLNLFIKPLEKLHKKQQQGPAHPAFYNSFNFTKMPTRKQMQIIQKQFELNQEELKVIGLTHTVKQLSMQKKRKVNLAKYKGDKKYNIDIKNPLFQLSFFREREKQMLRIQKQKRNRCFMTSRSSTPKKTRPSSAKTTFARVT